MDMRAHLMAHNWSAGIVEAYLRAWTAVKKDHPQLLPAAVRTVQKRMRKQNLSAYDAATALTGELETSFGAVLAMAAAVEVTLADDAALREELVRAAPGLPLGTLARKRWPFRR